MLAPQVRPTNHGVGEQWSRRAMEWESNGVGEQTQCAWACSLASHLGARRSPPGDDHRLVVKRRTCSNGYASSDATPYESRAAPTGRPQARSRARSNGDSWRHCFSYRLVRSSEERGSDALERTSGYGLGSERLVRNNTRCARHRRVGRPAPHASNR